MCCKRGVLHVRCDGAQVMRRWHMGGTLMAAGIIDGWCIEDSG